MKQQRRQEDRAANLLNQLNGLAVPDDVSKIPTGPFGRSLTLASGTASPGKENITEVMNSSSAMNTVNEEERTVNESRLTNKGG